MASVERFRLPFQEQIAFFRQKLNLPTARWDDIWQSAHDRAFMVAGAQKADLLADLREAVGGYFERGDTIQDFRKAFERIVAERGWTGWTGEGSKAGRAWRTRVIFTTNVATSYAAGRYQQLTDPELLAERPYWRYVHNDSVTHPRPHHKAWGDAGLTLPHDHAFWKTHYPPNGWGCRCRIKAVRGPGAGDATEPPGGWNTTDPKTGAPPGIDKGWAYAPGASVKTSLQELIDQKLIKLDALIGAQMYAALAPALATERRSLYRAWLADVESAPGARKHYATVSAISPKILDKLAELGRRPLRAGITLRDVEALHMLRDAKQMATTAAGLPKAISRADLERLPEILDRPRATLLDTTDGSLLYVFEPTQVREVGKVVVRVDFVEEIRGSDGRKAKISTNSVRTAGLLDLADLRAGPYLKLDGEL